ncbi:MULTISPECIES: hypothetical protein [unclassified Microbacterium]|uniref:hypothetical protein n=1 Tax=unclassified Microbacterium TaxID=2609290 RepID=UPI000EA86099|nr:MULTISPECIES: hypothetical protein [unclassified Microbacterium]MBT2486646.1 hypothetical protein [Microbacterium sp. ISL-108]RKN69330.1 hypothetical protein D7252_18270 [Microbacterium sp. CGR2]
MKNHLGRALPKTLLGVVLTGALTASTGHMASATENASESATVSVESNSSRATAISADQISKYSDREVLELLLAGKGAIAEANPKIVDVLGFAPDRAEISDEDLALVVDAYLAFNPNFRDQVLPGLTSGAPNVVSESLGNFYKSVVEFWETDPIFAEAREVVGDEPLVTTNATGQAVQNVNFVVNINVLANINVAAVAIGGAVVLAFAYVYTRYLDDPNTLYEVDQANMVRDVTAALA